MLKHVDHKRNREETLRHIAMNMHYYLGCAAPRKPRGCLGICKHFFTERICRLFGRQHGNYLMFVYMFSKCLYILNVCGQFVLLNYFLTSNYYVFGYELVMRYSLASDWVTSERFPRVTMCDFKVRTLTSVNHHTVQCVLPINLFNEKVYIFVWFWYVFVAFLTFLSFLMWIFKIACTVDHIRYVKRHMKTVTMTHRPLNNDPNCSNEFVSRYLRQDGLLILRLVEMNANDLITGELVSALWLHFRNTRQEQEV